MHGSLDKTGKAIKTVYGRWGIGIIGLPVLVLIALVGLAIVSPNTSNWISGAVQAEFVGSNYGPETASTQLEKPATAIRTVRAN